MLLQIIKQLYFASVRYYIQWFDEVTVVRDVCESSDFALHKTLFSDF